jgi:uncharacterized protein
MRATERRVSRATAAALAGPVLAVAALWACEGAPPRAPASTPALRDAAADAAIGDAGEVVRLYERACDGGSAVGCNNLALEIFEGRASGDGFTLARGAALLQHACELGSATACGNLGYYLLEHRTLPRDETRAVGLLTRACEGGYFRACGFLGSLYYEGAREDVPRAVEVLDRGCKGHDALSCATLGSVYHVGKAPIAKDDKRALELFESACDAGIAFACTGMGTVLLLKEEPELDRKRAAAAYTGGCVDAFPAGCYALGVACAGKLGDVCGDRADAALRRACDLGHADGCALLGARLQKRGRR